MKESALIQQTEDYLDNEVFGTQSPQSPSLGGDPASPKSPGPSLGGRASEPSSPEPISPIKPKKEKNGIVIDVPIDDYMQLTMLKIQTGRTLKDLALQAIHDFVERNRVG